MARSESEINGAKTDLGRSSRFAVAPMIDWTDRHCRFFHRLLTRHALLYTEMLTSGAIIRGHTESLLFFRKEEHPIAVQIGGSDPEEVGEAARIASQFGCDKINFNASRRLGGISKMTETGQTFDAAGNCKAHPEPRKNRLRSGWMS